MSTKILPIGATLFVAVLVIIAVFNLFASSTRPAGPSLALSEFISDVDRGQIVDVVWTGHDISGHFGDGRSFTTYAPELPDLGSWLVARLMEHKVRISAAPTEPPGFSILISWIPLLVWFAVLWFFVAQPLRAATAALQRIERTIGQMPVHPGDGSRS